MRTNRPLLRVSWPASLIALLVAGGCGTSGTMSGQLSGPGTSPRPLTLSYTLGRTGDSGTLELALPRGEAFTGRLARVRATGTTATAPGIDLDFSATGWGQAADRWTFGRDDSDKMVALLQGNQGGVMRCRFTLMYPAGGLRDGGTGECQTNTGERIDVRF